MLSETLENNAKMLSMFFFTFEIDKNVVNENHDKLIQLRHEHRVHEVHEVSRGIDQPKWHNQILIEPVSGREGRLGNILSSDFYLMITGVEVNFLEYFSPD